MKNYLDISKKNLQLDMKKEEKRMRKEREKAAISAIRARKQQAQLAKKKSVTFSTQ